LVIDILPKAITKRPKSTSKSISISHYKKALEIDPTFSYSQRKIGINLCFLGKYKEGREVLKEAMDNEINSCERVYTMESITHSYLYEQDYLSALDAIDETIEMAFASESLFWEAWIAAKEHIALLGHIAMAQGETRSTFELFKNASIDDPFFHYLTARAKDKSGDKEAAAKYFRRAANWNTDSLHYALIRQKALARKVMLASTDAQ
jgi:tetratricopeptide (TPR) repeat protein